MKQFMDADGRAWRLSITVLTARQVRDALGVDLLLVSPLPAKDGKPAAASIFERLADVYTLVDVLFELCRSQAEKERIDATGFAEGLRGDVLESAYLALLDELVDFFPSDKRRLLAGLVARIRKVSQARATAAAAAVEMALEDPALDAMLEAAMRGESSTSLPPSSESSPGVSPSGS